VRSACSPISGLDRGFHLGYEGEGAGRPYPADCRSPEGASPDRGRSLKRSGRNAEDAAERRRPGRRGRLTATPREAVRPVRRVGARRGAARVEADGAPRLAGRASLLAAATTLFSSLGYDAVTTRQILERAGVEAPSLYHHFGSKLGLYRAVLREANEPFVDRFARLAEKLAARADIGVRERLYELVAVMLWGQIENPEGVQIILFEANRPGPRRYDVFAVWKRVRDVFARAIENGIEAGELQVRRGDADVAANLFVGALTVYAQLGMLGKQKAFGRKLAQQITDTLLDGLVAGPAGRS
jgi:AcrR family transcriptional regulator